MFNRLGGLLNKLPGPLQKAIFREFQPIRELFLEQRPPCIALIGGSGDLFFDWILKKDAHLDKSHASECRHYSHQCGSSIYVLDHWASPLVINRPPIDLIILMPGATISSGDALDHFLKKNDAPVVLWDSTEAADPLAMEAPHLSMLSRRVIARTSPADPLFEEILCAALPPCARLQFARLTNARRAQSLIASSLLTSFSAVCGIVGLQPIPLADLPVLSTLQGFMVALIIHTSGRPLRLRLALEFIGSLGLSVGAGFLFRETTRAIVRVIPFWGEAVSGFIAGAGTYALGRAAIAYFIDDSPIQETRRIFQSLLRSPTDKLSE
jgi:uncharacterized protein (DUF697 family)